MLDLEAIQKTTVANEPFSFFMTPAALSRADITAVNGDFPNITSAGIHPLEELDIRGAFAALIEEIKGGDLEALMEEKFGVDLSDKPLMVTVRGHCQKKDGRIHTDSTDKIVTCLLYLNTDWNDAGGRLRLLRSGTDIDDVIAEVPPEGGTLVAFKRSDNSWHGHLPFEGPRRYIMFNWVTSSTTLSKNVLRHRISSRLKRLNPFR